MNAVQMSFSEIENPVSWAVPTPELVAAIKAARWKVVDTETTGLTPGSEPLKLSAKEIREGSDSTLRMRVLTVGWLEGRTRRIESFDLDYVAQLHAKKECLSPAELVDAALTNAFIAHNANFDLYWCRNTAPTEPTLVLDTMLLARIIRPEVPIILQEMAANGDELKGTGDHYDRAALESVIGGRSGWSLADTVLALLRRVLPKGYQGPKNWVVSRLDMDEARYGYATSDVVNTWDLIELLFGLTPGYSEEDLLVRYAELKAIYPVIARAEPQVMGLVLMREKGMPTDPDHARRYAAGKRAEAVAWARKMAELAPELAPFERIFADPDKGVPAAAKAALAEAFLTRGVELRRTEKSGDYMVGEKDLRYAKAPVIPAAKPLFDAWVGVAKAKKVAGMAREVAAAAERSLDKRVHSLIGPGPVTGRLSSQDVNTQQFPRDQKFRDICKAGKKKKVLSADYGALDMRVGSALAVRAQREISQYYMGAGKRQLEKDVMEAVQFGMEHDYVQYEGLVMARLAELEADLATLKEELETKGLVKKAYWEKRRALSRKLLLGRFILRLMEVRYKAQLNNEPEFSALRDAFRLGVDIHTFTAIGMQGLDAKAEFQGLPPKELEDKQEAWKSKLKKHPEGDKRQAGKVANLSLLYAMKDRGLQEAAGKNYGMYWTLEEAEKIRLQWLNAYPEIDLWHLWTELTPEATIWGVDPDTGRRTKLAVYRSVTLDGRELFAFGINAALSYQDQSTGADILARVMHTARTREPDLFECIFNQVHDEVLLELDEDVAEANTVRFVDLMNEQAEVLLMPYGVPSSVGPALGDVWIKD